MDSEKRIRIFSKALWQCEYPECISGAKALAHRIANTDANAKYIKRRWEELFYEPISISYARKILNHDLNLVPCCMRQSHNDYFNCGGDPSIVDQILKEIHEYRSRARKLLTGTSVNPMLFDSSVI